MRTLKRVAVGSTLVFACLLSLGLMLPGTALTGQMKVDVCHMEGNGSYHLITVAEPAYETHTNHGDAMIGEAVPGHAEFVFDDACNLVGCPCDFSASNFNALGHNPNEACLEFSLADPLLGAIVMTMDDLTFDAFSQGLDFSCVVSDINGSPEDPVVTDGFQAAACVNDINAAAQALVIPACD